MILRFILTIILSFAVSDANQMFQSVDSSKATLIGVGKEREYCPNCGMNLIKFHKTNHIHKDKQYCSLHCMYEATGDKMPKDAKVMDTKNLKFIDVFTAFYVVGSSVKGTMTMKSEYAFSNEIDAKEFQAKYGGEILNFKQAYKIAGEDFEADKKMIKTKRKNGIYEKGKQIYENRCNKIDIKAYANIAALKSDLTNSCKDLKDDGELQAVALYLWDAPKDINRIKKVTFERIIVPKDARCPVCGMLVAKNPNWATMIEAGDKKFYFDGVKDMMKYYFKNNKKFEKIFVSDYYKLRKIDAKNAFYVIGSNVFGPMGSELIPFASEEEAKIFAKDHGGKRVLNFDEIDEGLIKGL